MNVHGIFASFRHKTILLQSIKLVNLNLKSIEFVRRIGIFLSRINEWNEKRKAMKKNGMGRAAEHTTAAVFSNNYV